MNFITTVRYGKMCLTGRCRTHEENLGPRDRCVVRTDRGKEMGTVLGEPKPVSEEEPKGKLFEIIRKATPQDIESAERIDVENRRQAMNYCKEQIARLKIPMHLVEVDHLLGGERILFYFTAESRVDFRELVRILAREFRTRVELRQIGGRDEARLVGDVGHCGICLCCRGHVKELGGISMEMAKIQKHTSDPSKITGRCGKLLCCLRYEYAPYAEAKKQLPRKGRMIRCPQGEGRVISHNFLTREVSVVVGDGPPVTVGLDEIERVEPPPRGERPDDRGGEQGEGEGPRRKRRRRRRRRRPQEGEQSEGPRQNASENVSAPAPGPDVPSAPALPDSAPVSAPMPKEGEGPSD